MTKINRGEIVSQVTDALKLDVANGIIPNDSSDKIVLTYDYSNSKYCTVIKENSTTSTGAALIYTTPSDRDFYLSSIWMNYETSATCDAVGAFVSIVPYGSASSVGHWLRKLSLTAQCEHGQIVFNPPIRLARNTQINVSSTFTVGSMVKGATITGYEVS